jgi:hypothetical protein
MGAKGVGRRDPLAELDPPSPFATRVLVVDAPILSAGRSPVASIGREWRTR